jgi:hypothetical protein
MAIGLDPPFFKRFNGGRADFLKNTIIFPCEMRVRMPVDWVGYVQTFIVVCFRHTGMEFVKTLLKCF